MPDADDFDVEELRALLRGETPKQREAQAAGAPKPAPQKPGGAKRAAAKPAARRTKGPAR